VWGLLENVGGAGCFAPHLLARGCWIEPQEFTGVPPVPQLCRDSQASRLFHRDSQASRLFHRGREGRGGRAVSFSNQSTAKILGEKIHVVIGD